VPFREHIVPFREHFVPFREHFVPFREHFVRFREHFVRFREHFLPFREHFVPFREHFVRFREHFVPFTEHFVRFKKTFRAWPMKTRGDGRLREEKAGSGGSKRRPPRPSYTKSLPSFVASGCVSASSRRTCDQPAEILANRLRPTGGNISQPAATDRRKY
jgi:hypothetical protein